MSYGIAFLALGAVLSWVAAANGGWWLILLWPATSYVWASGAYILNKPAMFGKSADGSLASWAWLVAGPFIGLTWLIWRVERRLRGQPCATLVAEGIWVGRRPLLFEIPPGAVVLDMTAELPAASGVVGAGRYVCIPTLDATAPDPKLVTAALVELHSPVLIHCASGHGRSATVAAVLLIRRGLAEDVATAEALLRSRRPAVALNSEQRRMVLEACSADAASTSSERLV